MARDVCEGCGTALAPPGARRCGACGHVHFGRLVLTAEAGGRAITSGTDLDVGRRLLEAVAPDDARYVSSPQFELRRDAALGAWALRACESAVNPTCLNGVALRDEARALTDGDVISVGPDRLRLTVRIED